MRIVLDTNVLVSGIMNPRGCPGRIIDFLASGTLEIVVDDRILDEYADVLSRNRFKKFITTSEVKEMLEYLVHNSLRVSCTRVVKDMPDHGDIAFLETALTADVPLVTGNTKHYPKHAAQNCTILTPRQFLDAFPSK